MSCELHEGRCHVSLNMSGRCAAGQHLFSLPKTCDSSSDRYGLLMISASLMLPLYVLAGRLRCPRTSRARQDDAGNQSCASAGLSPTKTRRRSAKGFDFPTPTPRGIRAFLRRTWKGRQATNGGGHWIDAWLRGADTCGSHRLSSVPFFFWFCSPWISQLAVSDWCAIPG